MRVLWEKSAMSGSRDMMVAQVLAVEGQLVRMQQSGKLKPADRMPTKLFGQ